MDKFTKIKPKDEIKSKKEEVLFSNDHLQIIKYKEWSIVKEEDCVVCIPFLIELNQIILRYEFIPTFKYVDGQEYHITLVGGGIKKGESPEKALLREIEEEAGLVISPDFEIEFLKPFYISKSCSAKYHPCILNLSERNYQEIKPEGDGSKEEKLSKPVKVDVKYIKSINPSDLITEYMLNKFKDINNIK